MRHRQNSVGLRQLPGVLTCASRSLRHLASSETGYEMNVIMDNTQLSCPLTGLTALSAGADLSRCGARAWEPANSPRCRGIQSLEEQEKGAWAPQATV